MNVLCILSLYKEKTEVKFASDKKIEYVMNIWLFYRKITNENCELISNKFNSNVVIYKDKMMRNKIKLCRESW